MRLLHAFNEIGIGGINRGSWHEFLVPCRTASVNAHIVLKGRQGWSISIVLDLAGLAPEWPLDSVANLHPLSLVAGDGTQNIQQVASAINLDDAQILFGDALVAHSAGHLFALPDPAGILAGTGRTKGAVRLGDTVRGGHPAKAPALHGALKALPFALAGDVDALSRHEMAGVYGCIDGNQVGRIGNSKFANEPGWRFRTFINVFLFRKGLILTQDGRINALALLFARRDRDSCVPVLFFRLVAEDSVLVEQQDRARIANAPNVVKDGHHADFNGERPTALVAERPGRAKLVRFELVLEIAQIVTVDEGTLSHSRLPIGYKFAFVLVLQVLFGFGNESIDLFGRHVVTVDGFNVFLSRNADAIFFINLIIVVPSLLEEGSTLRVEAMLGAASSLRVTVKEQCARRAGSGR